VVFGYRKQAVKIITDFSSKSLMIFSAVLKNILLNQNNFDRKYEFYMLKMFKVDIKISFMRIFMDNS